jgi:hypothetical protein
MLVLKTERKIFFSRVNFFIGKRNVLLAVVLKMSLIFKYGSFSNTVWLTFNLVSCKLDLISKKYTLALYIDICVVDSRTISHISPAFGEESLVLKGVSSVCR